MPWQIESKLTLAITHGTPCSKGSGESKIRFFIRLCRADADLKAAAAPQEIGAGKWQDELVSCKVRVIELRDSAIAVHYQHFFILVLQQEIGLGQSGTKRLM